MKVDKWLNENFDKKSDWVLITGASSGIGYEYLKAFANLGCNILSVCNQREANLEISKVQSKKYGVKIEPIYADLSSLQDVDKLISTIEPYSIRVLISNAGFGIKGNFAKIDPVRYKQIIGVHVVTPTLLTHSVLNGMLKTDRGLIITVASINVVSPIPGNTVYTATKAFQYSFSLALAHENRHSKLKFQTLLPGTTDTPFHARQGAVPKALTMKPDVVVQRSLSDIDQKVCIPNRVDRLGYPVLSRMPIQSRMIMTKYILHKRLTF